MRAGSQTIKASEDQFDRLIAERSSKTYRILQCVGKTISVHRIRSGRAAQMQGRVASQMIVTAVDCGQFNVTLRDYQGNVQRIGLDRVQILEEPSFRNVITLEVSED